MSPPLTGLIAAVFTPFKADLSLNLAVIDRYARFLEEQGTSGVFVCGTTGEGASLSATERQALAEKWMSAAHPLGLKVVVQVGSNVQSEACALAAHAVKLGVDAVAALAPCFFKPATVEALVEFTMPIAEAAGDVPFYFYDIPSFTGTHLPASDYLAEGRKRMPNLRGLKFSHLDLVQLQQCLGLDGGFDVLFGIDEALLAALALGVRGAIGANYNIAAPHYLQIMKAFDQGDMETARRLQRQSVATVKKLASFGFFPAAKAMLATMGIDCGPVRPPLRNLTPSQIEQLKST